MPNVREVFDYSSHAALHAPVSPLWFEEQRHRCAAHTLMCPNRPCCQTNMNGCGVELAAALPTDISCTSSPRLTSPFAHAVILGASVAGKVRTVKLLSEDPDNYPDAPREGIRRIIEVCLVYSYHTSIRFSFCGFFPFPIQFCWLLWQLRCLPATRNT